MANTALIGGVVVLLIIVVGVVAYFMMTGGDSGMMGPGPTGPTGPTAPKGQYVQVKHTVAYDASGYDVCEKSRVINLQEIEVYTKSGTKISQGKTVTSGKGFHGVDPTGAKFVDGIVGNVDNFGHTVCDLDESHMDYVRIDLGSKQEIGKVIIYNRSDGGGRLNGCKVQILDTDGTTIVKETPVISGAKYKHEYDFAVTSPSWKITSAS